MLVSTTYITPTLLPVRKVLLPVRKVLPPVRKVLLPVTLLGRYSYLLGRYASSALSVSKLCLISGVHQVKVG